MFWGLLGVLLIPAKIALAVWIAYMIYSYLIGLLWVYTAGYWKKRNVLESSCSERPGQDKSCSTVEGGRGSWTFSSAATNSEWKMRLTQWGGRTIWMKWTSWGDKYEFIRNFFIWCMFRCIMCCIFLYGMENGHTKLLKACTCTC